MAVKQFKILKNSDTTKKCLKMQFVYFCSAIHVIELHFFPLLLYFDNNLYVQYVHSFEK